MNSQNATHKELLEELEELQKKYAVMEALLAKNNTEKTDKFKLIFEQAAVGMAQVDAQTGKFVKINQKYAQLLGYTIEEMLVIDFQTITFSEDLAEDLQNMKLLKNGEIREFTVEKRYIHKNGHLIWVGLAVSALWEKGSIPDFNVAVVTDITERKQTEQALKNERLRFQDIADTTDGIIWELDYATLLFTYVSQKAVRLLGYDLEEWYQPDFWFSHIHEEDKSWAVDYCKSFSAKLETHELEYRFFAKDGRMVWLRDIVSVVSDKNKPTYLCGVMIDITEQKKAEETLRISEQRLKTIIETEPECVKIISTEGELLEMNAAGLAMLEANSLEEVKAHSPTLAKFIVPKYLKDFDILYQKAFGGENGLLEFEASGLKGTHKWFETHVAPLRNENNEITSLLAITRDITARKNTEQQYKRSNQLLEESQLIAKVGGWELDLISGELYWTAETYRIHDTSPEEFNPTVDAGVSYFLPKSKQIITEALELAMTQCQGYDLYLETYTTKGRRISVRTTCEVISIDGKATTLRGIFQDITTQKNVEEQLKNQNKILQLQNSELEQFTYITSHDLQEPLHTIISFAELFQEEYITKVDGNAELYINFIVKSSKRMQVLVKGLLDYSRIGREREKIKIDCNLILNDIIADMTTCIVSSKAEITVEDLPIIQGYAIELKLLFKNLLSNAMKFTSKDVTPKINISAKNTAQGWLFAVRDNGIGIDEKNREKIFIIFKRLHNRDEYEGTGIGLSHCKKIVALHGGTIWVENYEGGSIFYFTIPKK